MFNPVSVGRIELNYTMTSTGEDNIYSCERNWRILSVRNMSDKPLDSYCLVTATDIGDQQNPNIKLMNCVDNKQFVLNQNDYRNNGIYCWRWEIKPSVEGSHLMNDMELRQFVKDAWNFNTRKQEVMYFIPIPNPQIFLKFYK